jgi:hypothetical protein
MFESWFIKRDKTVDVIPAIEIGTDLKDLDITK